MSESFLDLKYAMDRIEVLEWKNKLLKEHNLKGSMQVQELKEELSQFKLLDKNGVECKVGDKVKGGRVIKFGKYREEYDCDFQFGWYVEKKDGYTLGVLDCDGEAWFEKVEVSNED